MVDEGTKTVTILLAVVVAITAFIMLFDSGGITGAQTSNKTGVALITVVADVQINVTGNETSTNPVTSLANISFGSLTAGQNKYSATNGVNISHHAVHNVGTSDVEVRIAMTDSLFDMNCTGGVVRSLLDNETGTVCEKMRCDLSSLATCVSSNAEFNLPIPSANRTTGCTDLRAGGYCRFAMNVTVPNEENSGTKSATITYYATEDTTP